MDLNRVRIFVEVVEHGSFTAAAAALGLPKSSVSRAVAKLEQELGATLLHRTTRSLRLTDAGRAYADRARGALQELGAAADRVRGALDEARGLVRLTAPPNFGRMLGELLARFLRAHPHVQLEVTLSNRTVDLIEEGIDLALRAGRLADSSLVARKIAASAWALYAAPAYLEQHGRPRRIADLARHPCLLFRAPGATARWTLHGPRGAQTVAVTGPLSCDELAMLVEACRQGVGIALLPGQAATAAVEAGELVPLLPDFRVTGGALWLVYPPDRRMPRRVELLRDFLLAELRAPSSA